MHGTQRPVWTVPLFLLAQLYSQAGDRAAARREFVDAVYRQPANPQSWEQLGCYDLGQHAAAAVGELDQALMLDPRQSLIRTGPRAFCATSESG